MAPQLSFETTRSDPSPRVEEHDEDDVDNDNENVQRGDLHHDEQVDIETCIASNLQALI